MPGEEAQAYQDHVCRFIDEFAPANAREEEIVQSLADTRWRLLRIPALESNIYALGQLEFGEKFSIEAGPVSAWTHPGEHLSYLPEAIQQSRYPGNAPLPPLRKGNGRTEADPG
jgi:hypothetical protein